MRATLAGAALGISLLGAAPFELPPETAAFAPGPHIEVVRANCVSCHSADYVSTHPRSLANPGVFWTAEVAKMRRAFKAPISDDEAQLIVEYLVAAYAR